MSDKENRTKRLIAQQKRLKVSQVKLANLLGKNPRTVRRYFAGDLVPSETTVRLAESLKIPVKSS